MIYFFPQTSKLKEFYEKMPKKEGCLEGNLLIKFVILSLRNDGLLCILIEEVDTVSIDSEVNNLTNCRL